MTVPLSRFAAGGIEHGYALTIHRAQGITVDTCLLMATQALSRESGYVALSRGRKANHLFSTWQALTSNPDTADTDAGRDVDSTGALDLGPEEQLELTRAALVAQLETRRAQRLASQQQQQRHHDLPQAHRGRSR